MKKLRCVALALICLLVLPSMALATGAGYAYNDGLTDEEYQIYYEVCDHLLSDWDAPIFDLLDGIAPDYGVDAEDLYDFILYAAGADREHVWVPVKGGIKFHDNPDCSGMIEPRPTTLQDALDMGFTACKRCNPYH